MSGFNFGPGAAPGGAFSFNAPATSTSTPLNLSTSGAPGTGGLQQTTAAAGGGGFSFGGGIGQPQASAPLGSTPQQPGSGFSFGGSVTSKPSISGLLATPQTQSVPASSTGLTLGSLLSSNTASSTASQQPSLTGFNFTGGPTAAPSANPLLAPSSSSAVTSSGLGAGGSFSFTTGGLGGGVSSSLVTSSAAPASSAGGGHLLSGGGQTTAAATTGVSGGGTLSGLLGSGGAAGYGGGMAGSFQGVAPSLGVGGMAVPGAAPATHPSSALVAPNMTAHQLPVAANPLTSGSGAVSSAPSALGASFLTASSVAAPAPSFGVSAPSSISSTTGSASLTTATTTSTWWGGGAGAPNGGGASVRQLEERLNKWLLEVREQEERFLKQAQHVTAWDRVLQRGHGQVHELRTALDTVQSDQNRLEAELDFIRGQQSELEQLLAPLEATVNEAGSSALTGASQHQGDRQRDNMYHLAQNLDGQLRQMSEDLVKVIEHVNTLNGSSEKPSDPVSLVAKILSAHMDTLKWVDQNALMLTQKVEEVSKNV